VLGSSEARVFHRRGNPIPVVHAVESIAALPNEKWTKAQLNSVKEGRQKITANIEVPAAAQPACLVVSRPFFPGYIASLDRQSLEVTSYRGLIPMIKVPPNMHGRLTIRYRPTWLICGGTIAVISLLGWVAGLGCALRSR
jgi:hypothetical protein